jgi:hypothetical protein
MDAGLWLVRTRLVGSGGVGSRLVGARLGMGMGRLGLGRLVGPRLGWLVGSVVVIGSSPRSG